MTIEANVSQDKRILICLSVGLLQQAQEIGSGTAKPVTLLNENIRRGWEQYCYLSYSKGILPPQTLTEFIAFLHRPLSEWPALNAVDVDTHQPLLDDGLPSPLCESLGGDWVNIRFLDLEFEDMYFMALMNACKQANDALGYSLAREFLVRNSVLHDPYSELLAKEVWLPNIREALKNCYEIVPRGLCVRRGMVMLCPHCGWILEWHSNEAKCHLGGVCEDLYGDLSQYDITIQHTPMLMRTKGGIQRYVSAVEKSLIEVYDKLRGEWSVQCSLYPHFDTYDLFLTFSNGQCWAVDFKDYHSARSLAQALNSRPYPFEPTWDAAFYIFPDYRARKEYLNEFNNFWKRRKDIDFMSAGKFVEKVRKEI